MFGLLFQVEGIVEFIQTFIFLVEDDENNMQRAVSYKLCQHGVPQSECTKENKYDFPCPTEETLKYRLTRASVDSVDVYIVDTAAALNLQVCCYSDDDDDNNM